eukprot:jgi/Mesvir1/15854/Mv03401-RA.1
MRSILVAFFCVACCTAWTCHAARPLPSSTAIIAEIDTLASSSTVTRPPPLIWPLPAQFDRGNATVCVSRDLVLVPRDTKSELLLSACERYRLLIIGHDAHGASPRGNPAGCITRVSIYVSSKDETLQQGTDESYVLDIPAAGPDAAISAGTVYGALRALETLSQLAEYSFDSKQANIADAPWHIVDFPRFSYRGLLLDTARHFQPMEVLRHVVDSMSYAKLNVLHWHLVDSQSFPLESSAYPRLWMGAFSPTERYSRDEVAELVEYARRRGVRVVPELDIPGHAASWGVGYPELWPSPDCREPLNPVSGLAFAVISGLLDELASLFPDPLVHLGGDEVSPTCWDNSTAITEWMSAKGLNSSTLYEAFVRTGQAATLENRRQPIHWQEVFDNFGKEGLSRDVIIQAWYPLSTLASATAAGLRGIRSNSDAWYLDWLHTPWTSFYLNDPLEGLPRGPEGRAQAELVLGGEVCMWGETADFSVLLQTIWPRAAAAAERLWSPEVTTGSIGDAEPRLKRFRCEVLMERGIPAAPVLNSVARSAPEGPGSCGEQRR